MAHYAQSIDALAGDEKIQADEILRLIALDVVIKTSVAGGDGLELIVKIGEKIRHWSLEADDGARFEIG